MELGAQLNRWAPSGLNDFKHLDYLNYKIKTEYCHNSFSSGVQWIVTQMS